MKFKRTWTEEQEMFLMQHSKQMSDKKIAEYLGKTEKAVVMKRYTMTHPSRYYSGQETYSLPPIISKYERIFRIERLAEEMRVKLLG